MTSVYEKIFTGAAFEAECRELYGTTAGMSARFQALYERHLKNARGDVLSFRRPAVSR